MPKRNYSARPGWCKQAKRKSWVDRIQADLVLEDIQLNARRTIHDECRSYHCKFGNHWHLTSEDRRAENRDMFHSA